MRDPLDHAAGHPAPAPAADDDGYRATALGSHWFAGPDSGPAAPESPPGPAPGPAPGPVPRPGEEGELRRFGPGVTASARSRIVADPATAAAVAAGVWHGPPRPGRLRRLVRRYAPAAVVLVVVLALLLWQRYGRPIAVEAVSVRAVAASLGCGDTAEVVAVVDTNGRSGTLVYRWVRSDGTSSERLRQKLAHGQEQARLRLLWSFQGPGRYRAGAELRVVSPSEHRSAARFDYRCG
ncbi:hypothetical protein GCM10010387_23670 [Streptomyces inusitatus]|uniref:Uncharacterized protein n=1 Tax=Streptomyces inusitatus TaxID=68221 RepID=A0A918URN3_9ACTN|nr:hypothetical protein [Streptomyces inusitatus]GGZ29555.1 hypothetical protein GCM10010387_23670 [Streptomyces inusitatus]